MQVHFTYYESPIGLVKIGGTEQYITELKFIDNSDQLENGEPGIPDILHSCTEQLIEYFSGRRKYFDIPIHQEGTPFQEEVWGELMSIPYGKTISYAQLSRLMGDPNAVRAVANANSKNKITVIVPCHRVVGSNNNLVGYSGGLWRKRWLLQHEFNNAHGVQTLF